MENFEASVFLDPLFARIAVFDNGAAKIAFIQLELLSMRWSDASGLRKIISAKYSFPADNIMVSATHNHAGPAISNLSPMKKQLAYLADMKLRCVDCFGGVALGNLTEAEIGYGSEKELEVAYNRRTVMRNGTTRTHGSFLDPDALYVEGLSIRKLPL